jgi:hypothetical protein
VADPFCWIIAESEQAARDLYREWMFTSVHEQIGMERRNVCFKGYHDAVALLDGHSDDGVNRRIWRVDIGVTAVDVPRETSQHEHVYDRTIGCWPSGPDGETDCLKACACGERTVEEM